TKETIDELRQKIGALELKRNEAEQAALEGNVTLQETKRYLTRLIESSPDAVISTNKEGNIVLFSESAESLLGYRAKEVTGQGKSRARCASAGEAFLTLRASCLRRMAATFLS